jgi:hypothetical protein
VQLDRLAGEKAVDVFNFQGILDAEPVHPRRDHGGQSDTREEVDS